MRIIAGKFKGRKLFAPPDNQVRPTTDKVKEALFSMLAEYIDEGSVVVDLFSGSGNLGLEAISRGAASVYFCDKSRASLALTKKNIAHVGAEAQAKVIPGDYSAALAKLPEPADVFFLDPPYKDGLIADCMALISRDNLLRPEGVIVAEHDVKDQLPGELHGFSRIKEKRYGTINVTLYCHTQEEDI